MNPQFLSVTQRIDVAIVVDYRLAYFFRKIGCFVCCPCGKNGEVTWGKNNFGARAIGMMIQTNFVFLRRQDSAAQKSKPKTNIPMPGVWKYIVTKEVGFRFEDEANHPPQTGPGHLPANPSA